MRQTIGALIIVLSCNALVRADDANDAVARLIAAARIYDQREMTAATEALVGIGAPAVPSLQAALDDFDDNVRWQAIVALGRIGKPSRVTIPDLRNAVTDVDPDVRAAAAEALGLLKSNDARSMSCIRQSRNERHGLVRASAEWSLWKLSNEKQSIGRLVGLLGDQDWMVCQRAERFLSQIGTRAVPLLCKALESQSHPGRQHVAKTIGRIGPSAKAAIPALVSCLADSESRLSSAAAMALGQMGAVAVDPLIRFLNTHHAAGRTRALLALAAIGPDASPALAIIIHEIHSANKPRKIAAIKAAAAIGPQAKKATPVLVSRLDNRDEDVRGAICAAIGRIGGTATTVRDRLSWIAEHDDEDFVRRAAENSLRSLSR